MTTFRDIAARLGFQAVPEASTLNLICGTVFEEYTVLASMVDSIQMTGVDTGHPDTHC